MPEDPLLVIGGAPRASRGGCHAATLERRWSTRAAPGIAVGPLAVDVAALLAETLGVEPDAVADLPRRCTSA
ncbi:MAG: hypothetical protein IPN17_35065 [Deltaproteobacteria bacterium]|nr:hypothetical protein [Deltaproteobacteria bacterium]